MHPVRIAAVVFDLHSTLVDQGSATGWLARAGRRLGWPHPPERELGEARARSIVDFLEHVWERAREIDPHNERDRSPQRHRAVYEEAAARFGLEGELAAAVYEVMPEHWRAYSDAAPTLQALRDRGLRLALLSNIGFDARPILTRAGLLPLLDVVTLSCEVGSVKPERAIFERTLERLEVTPAEALMVGDHWRDDAAAAGMGIRTLVLPRTNGDEHGLRVVVGLVDAANAA